MAKKRKKSTGVRRRRSPVRAKRSTRRRGAVRTAGFAVTPMALLLGVAGAVAAPLVLDRLTFIADARMRYGAGAVAGYFGARMMPSLAPVFGGFALASGVMAVNATFPNLLGPAAAGGTRLGGRGDTLRGLSRADEDRLRQRIQARMGMNGVPVINGLPGTIVGGYDARADESLY